MLTRSTHPPAGLDIVLAGLTLKPRLRAVGQGWRRRREAGFRRRRRRKWRRQAASLELGLIPLRFGLEPERGLRRREAPVAQAWWLESRPGRSEGQEEIEDEEGQGQEEIAQGPK
eukprot:scaffold35308_cov101-Isochrysis_galbana.AAC.1